MKRPNLKYYKYDKALLPKSCYPQFSTIGEYICNKKTLILYPLNISSTHHIFVKHAVTHQKLPDVCSYSKIQTQKNMFYQIYLCILAFLSTK